MSDKRVPEWLKVLVSILTPVAAIFTAAVKLAELVQ